MAAPTSVHPPIVAELLRVFRATLFGKRFIETQILLTVSQINIALWVLAWRVE